VEKDIQLAMKYYNRAAKLNNPNALNSLGEIYLKYELDENYSE